jgi:hypothetical protein
VVRVLENKYYMDWINENIFAAGARLIGRGLWKGGDVGLIDGLLVNGSARVVGWCRCAACRADRFPVLVRAGDDAGCVWSDDVAAVAPSDDPAGPLREGGEQQWVF